MLRQRPSTGNHLVPDFLYPWALALLPLPWLVWRLRSAEPALAGLAIPQRLAGLLERASDESGKVTFYRRGRLLLATLGWLALVLAVAAPLSRGGALQFASGRDLLLAIDLSASMRATDVQLDGRQVDRYTAVKSLAAEFIRGRAGDRVGLIVFADEPYLLAPLTYDVNAVSGFLDEVQVGLPGRKTAVGDAIGLAVKTLEQQPLAARVIVMLSDGDSNAGLLSPKHSAQLALDNQVKIHTIGFGGQRDAVDGANPNNNNSTDDNARVTANSQEPAKINALQSIAEATGGRHYIARTTGALRQVYASLDSLETTETQAHGQTVEQDWVQECTLLALLCLAALTLLDLRRGRL